jgi:hypothetical protein
LFACFHRRGEIAVDLFDDDVGPPARLNFRKLIIPPSRPRQPAVKAPATRVNAFGR